MNGAAALQPQCFHRFGDVEEIASDEMRLSVCRRLRSVRIRIVQDCQTAQTTRGGNVPCDTVAYDADLVGPNVERIEDPFVGSGVGLADADLSLNLDQIEGSLQAEPFDLRALKWSGSIGQ